MKELATSYRSYIYPILVRIEGGFSDLFPFSLSEISLYLLGLITVYSLVRLIVRLVRRKPLHLMVMFKTVTILAIVLFLDYTLNCGINYRASGFAEEIGLKAGVYGRDELFDLCRLLSEGVRENCGFFSASEDLATDGAEIPILSESGDISGIDMSMKENWRAESTEAFTKLAEKYDVLSGFVPKPKPVLVSYLLSVQQVTGIYAPFFVEALYNRDMPDYNIPFTLCHELSHVRGFMKEDEANFISFLACTGSDDEAFRYSGYLTAFVYAGNALSAVDREGYLYIYETLPPGAKADLEANNAFWQRFAGPVADAQDRLNDVYLKAQGEKDGIASYDRFTKLLLAFYAES